MRNAAQDVKEGVMGMGQSAKESVTGRPTVSAAAVLLQRLPAMLYTVAGSC